MTMSLFTVALLGALLAPIYAWEQDVDCTSTTVDAAPGLLFVATSDGTGADCRDVDTASAEAGDKCYMTVADPESLGDFVKCPQDPAPPRNPDGSEATSVADGFISTWCSTGASLPGPIGEFASIVGCFQYGYYEANGDPSEEAETGAKGICDTIFAGACTWFFDISPELNSGMCDPCADDPNSVACGFGGPSKRSSRVMVW